MNSITIVVTDEAYATLKRISEQTGRSIRDLCEAAVEDECIRSERPDQKG